MSQRVRSSWLGLRIVPVAHKEVLLLWRLLLLSHGGWWWTAVQWRVLAGRAVELDVALHAFAATVEVDGAWGDGQLWQCSWETWVAKRAAWGLGSVRLTAGGLAPMVSAACLCGVGGSGKEGQDVHDDGTGNGRGDEGTRAGNRRRLLLL